MELIHSDKERQHTFGSLKKFEDHVGLLTLEKTRTELNRRLPEGKKNLLTACRRIVPIIESKKNLPSYL